MFHRIVVWAWMLVALLDGAGAAIGSARLDVTGDPATSDLYSIETGYTISKVRVGMGATGTYVVASSYEGTLLGIAYTGELLWKNPLSGYMNQDVWCADVDGDGVDEILAANADGALYCLSGEGELLWQFHPSIAPMYTVCVVHRDSRPYVVCGSYDKNIYYLSGSGSLLKKVPSSGYSQEKPPRNYPKTVPPDNCHTSNFLRPVRQADGTEILAQHGVIHTMAITARGAIYLFELLEEHPFKIIRFGQGRPFGEMRVGDTDGDGNEELLFGGNGMIGSAEMVRVDPRTGGMQTFPISDLGEKIDRFGYRVVQPEVIETAGTRQIIILFGARLLQVPTYLGIEKTEVYSCRYSFNDIWQDRSARRLVFASAQSGGSCIHVANIRRSSWMEQYAALQPPGKIDAILENTRQIREHLATFKRPNRERHPLPVYLMAERITPSVEPLVEEIRSVYGTPVFLNGASTNPVEKWDRSAMTNDRYRDRRDRRMDYSATREEIVERISARYEDADGLAYWGGHGNDPYMFHLETTKAILDRSNGKKTVLIFPELEDHSHYFAEVMEDYFYPLAEHCRKTNARIYVRTKHNFWYGNAYLPMWSRLLSGEFADVFVPSMEETTDKSMELSLVARLGIWASGATDSWGSRCARDNPSFDRLRQFSHQTLPNHFLRVMVYHISLGATYINNFPVDQDYMSLLWELIAKGALYVPKSDEIVSFSPVHLSMLDPDEDFLEEGSNTKWASFFEPGYEEANPFVFSRLNGTWPGAPNTAYDFSRYAAGVKERRLNFLPPYKNGLVLMTPPQAGAHAAVNPPRGRLIDHLHPLYRGVLREFYTDGRDYYSADGSQRFPANAYFCEVERAIEAGASRLPVTVSGGVAWVVAQTSPRHLRLTIIDGGYLNPHDRLAAVTFRVAKPRAMTDILTGEAFEVTPGGTTSVPIPCGAFRFFDIELDEPLSAQTP